MHLLRCNPPQGSLESAPRTSLRADSAQERWEGFWCADDDRYYTRCARADGSEQWYRFAYENTARVLPFHTPYVSVRGTSSVSVRRTSTVDTQDAPRTLTLDTRRTMLFGVYGQRSILVRLVRRRRARSAR